MKVPAFQFYPGDFLSSSAVQLMEPHEVGAYICLISHAWLNDRTGHLPNCDDRLRRLSRLTAKQWQRSRSTILEEFPEVTSEPNWRYSPWLIEEAKKQAIRRAKMAANGAKGGRPTIRDSSVYYESDNQDLSAQQHQLSENQKLFSEKPLVSERKANAKPFNSISPTSTSLEGECATAKSVRSRSTRKFCPPRLEQVQGHATENFPSEPAAVEEAARFFNHYESNGWLLAGKSEMIKWQPAFSNWMARRSQFNTTPGSMTGSQSAATPTRAQFAPKPAGSPQCFS